MSSLWLACAVVALCATASHPARADSSCAHCEPHDHGPAPSAELPFEPAVGFAAAPPAGGVNVSSNRLLLPVMLDNLDYLLSAFDLDHMLYYFRLRAGRPAPPGGQAQVKFWDTDLKGSNAGRFLMGAGNTLRWLEHPGLRARLDGLVDGIADCQNQSTGYILAFPPEQFMHSEQGDYGARRRGGHPHTGGAARSWFTQGLIEAGKAGNDKVWPLLRAQYDWFNDPSKNWYLPYLYDGVGNGEQGQIASTRLALETPVGTAADMSVARAAYRDEVWMAGLIARDPASISSSAGRKGGDNNANHPHCYAITAFLSMFDQFRATGNRTWLEAATGAWELIHGGFEHVDGSSSLTEGGVFNSPKRNKYIFPYDSNMTDWPYKSYRISPGTRTGETCCSVFWVKFNQRFQQLSPEQEKYTAEIETTIYNALLRQMVGRTASAGPGIRYNAVMEGLQPSANSINTCCEGQGTRVFGSLPEYIYSQGLGLDSSRVYVNLYAASSFTFNVSQAQPPPPLTARLLVEDGYHPSSVGSINPAPPSVDSLAACQAACFASGEPLTCMGFTFVNRSSSPCVLYTAIDLSAKPVALAGCQQYLVQGRMLELGRTTDQAVQLTADTDFPFDNRIHLTVEHAAVQSGLEFALLLRIPSWLEHSVPIQVANEPVARTGQPGTYLEIRREWASGDAIQFSLPTTYRLAPYTGFDQIPGYEGRRYAVQVGPVVLACVGPMNATDPVALLPVGLNVSDWLVPSGKEKLHYAVRNAPEWQLMPMWDVAASEVFTTYPVLAAM